MVTIFRESGLRFVIYLDDHPPPHVHVFGDGRATIVLGAEANTPKVVRTSGMNASELRKALRIVVEYRSALLEKWNDFHG